MQLKPSCENNNVESKTLFGRIFKLSTIAIALTGAVNYANAAHQVNGLVNSGDSIAISGNAGKKPMHEGLNPGTDTGNIAIGTDSAAQGGNSAAIGYESKTRGNGGTAVGQGAKAGVSKMMAQHLQLLVIMQMLLQGLNCIRLSNCRFY